MAASASSGAFAGNEPEGRWASGRHSVGEGRLGLGVAAVVLLSFPATYAVDRG